MYVFSWNTNKNLGCTLFISQRKKELLNPDSDIEIGNHVWVGQDVTILKNTKIGNNCVIGAGSLVNKNFIENNVVIAGNPAKIVKYDINWDRAIPSNFN